MVIDDTYVNIPEQKRIFEFGAKYKSLNAIELLKLSNQFPNYVFEVDPHYMVSVNKEWCLRHKKEWMLNNYTSLICEVDPHYVAIKHPDILMRINFVKLVEINPNWACVNQPERTFHEYPEVFSQYNNDMFVKRNKKDEKKTNILQRIIHAIKLPYIKRNISRDSPLPIECIDFLNS